VRVSTETAGKMRIESAPPSILGPLLRYWQEKRGDRALPRRNDIDPVEMGAALLPHLILTDLLDRGTRVRFRLVGTTVVKRIGFDPTGCYLDAALTGGWGGFLATLHRLLYAERVPIRADSEVLWGEGRRMRVEHLMLPLTQDGPDPAIALVGLQFMTAEAFPPALGAIAKDVGHGEISRSVLKSLPSLKPGRVVARDVA
jgi:hypothetical protein